jgi:hypothetical protein
MPEDTKNFTTYIGQENPAVVPSRTDPADVQVVSRKHYTTEEIQSWINLPATEYQQILQDPVKRAAIDAAYANQNEGKVIPRD